jgi:hypothetical protein
MCLGTVLIALGMAIGIVSSLEIVRPVHSTDPFYM